MYRAYLAAHGTEQRVPAGTDRRNYVSDDRRADRRSSGGYGGSDRRQVPEQTIKVLFAHAAGEAVPVMPTPSKRRAGISVAGAPSSPGRVGGQVVVSHEVR